jgi:hypothetical protein
VSLLITQHRARIKAFISQHGISLYRTVEDPISGRAFRGLDFKEWNRAAARFNSECPYVLRADISRFFYTIYTHSIPWSVLGKERAKDWLVNNKKKLDAHWSSQLDRALQACQSRETFGIPVGPDTSRLIAEVLMVGVESDSDFSRSIAGRPACRLIDDFMIGFENENEAVSALATLRSALWKYNLQLNDGKTKISRSRLLYQEKWKHELSLMPLSNLDPRSQDRDLHRLVDVTQHFCSESGSALPATRATWRIIKLKNVGKNFSSILDILFRLARDYPVCTSHVAQFLINNQSLCRTSKMKQRVEKWLNTMVADHFHNSHDYEIAWCLLVAGVLRISINAEYLRTEGVKHGSIVIAILWMLQKRGLLRISMSKFRWKARFKMNGVYSENWLLMYEAVRRKWTKDKRIIKAVKRDPVLDRMLKSNVTFLEDDIFKATRIDVSRRIFSKSAAATKLSARDVAKAGADQLGDETDEDY